MLSSDQTKTTKAFDLSDLAQQTSEAIRQASGQYYRLVILAGPHGAGNLTGADNIWRQFDQVVCPVDAIKPVEKRRGWPKEKLEAHNQERLGDLIDAGWDLII
jgi:hypothetical protein